MQGLNSLRCVAALESAVESLGNEFHQCDLVRLDTSALGKPNIGETTEREFLGVLPAVV